MELSRQFINGACDVTLHGKITFDDYPIFGEILNIFEDDSVRQVTLHMQHVEFMDSSALGMMLLALEKAQASKKGLLVKGPTGQIKKMFDLARFDTLFTMG